jgi:hypothetical protein
MYAVVLELEEETARRVLDPLALGLRYAEVEAIRRKVSEDWQRLNQANQAVLNETQRVKFSALQEAVRLRATVEEARSAEILGSRCKQLGVLFVDFSQPFFGILNVYLGDCPDRRALEELP